MSLFYRFTKTREEEEAEEGRRRRRSVSTELSQLNRRDKGTDSVHCISRAAMDVALYVIAAAVLVVLILFAVKVRRQTRAGRTASLRSAAAVGPLPGCRHAAVQAARFRRCLVDEQLAHAEQHM